MFRLWALLLLGTPALAQDIRPQEADRLAGLTLTLGTALRQALMSGARGDVDLLQEAMEGVPLPPLTTSLEGDWSCRMLKLGGTVSLVSYAAFDCRFTADGDGFMFEKLTGSQRTKGRVALMGDQMIYLGVGFVADGVPPAYAELPDGIFGDGEVQPQVGVVEQSGTDSARILFPAPVTESLLDVLYLTR